MKKVTLTMLALVAFLAVNGLAQERYFGKNKVQYKKFDWNYIQTRHFDVYFYENAYQTAKFAADVMEDAYTEVNRELDYRIQRRIPVFVYNSQNDFQQTNITTELLPEGVGGFTEAFKNRIVVPFTGSYEDFRHVLHHELTHAVVYDMLFGNSFASLLSRQRLFNLPLWFAEGYAEYSSRRGWDYWSDMYVRDATINNYLAAPDFLNGFIAYKQGQAMVKYIADKYGEAKLGEILQKGKIHLTMNKALKASIGIDEKQLFEEFSKEMKRRYWPDISVRKEPADIGKQLTHARKDGSYLNERPAYSPEGDMVAIFSDRHDYDEIVLLSAATGEELSRLVKAARSGDLESLHSFFSGMSFSPDGRQLAFVSKSKGKDAIYIVDVKKKDIVRRIRLDFYNVLSPMFSPDGGKIAFSALANDKRDLYLFDLNTGALRKLTDDRFDDVEPSWMRDSRSLVFASDRPHPAKPALTNLGQAVGDSVAPTPGGFSYGVYNLFKLDLDSLSVSPLDFGPGSARSPVVSPNGKMVAFVSNRNGMDNIYVGYLDSASCYAVTDILTGARDLSWSPDGQKLAFSAFNNGGYDVFVLKDFVPVGDRGALTATDFMRGKFEHPFEKALAPATGTPKDSAITKDSAALAMTLPGDSSHTADTATATGPDEDTVVSQTGIIGEDYVFVSNRTGDPMDSLLRRLPGDDTLGLVKPTTEPASFDSIPPPSESGDYKIHKYKVKFTPDYVGGGFAYDTFFGMRGQSIFVFSDYLGNHQILVAADIVNTIDQSFVQAFYVNNTGRLHFGTGLFHTKNFYIDATDHLFSDRYYGVTGFMERPGSTFSRFEALVSQIFVDRKYYDFDDTRSDRSTKVTYGAVSYVFDNVLWGYTGPINGRRYKMTLDAGINVFDSRDISFHSVDVDYRRYWDIAKTGSFAFRLAGGASFGRTPKTYFLGGVSNWVGSRNLEQPVYEVENLYFADVITPMRGVPLYGVAGNRYAVINAEIRFPLVQVLAFKFPLPLVFQNIRGALFTDVGAAWSGSDFKGGSSVGGRDHLQDIRTGFGFGMRMNLAGLALLRYDIAWTTDLDKVSDRPTHYFSLGADF